jgi:hypothetical protein
MKNQYKVPKKKWRKWSPRARSVFNLMYKWLIHGQEHMLHPKTEIVPRLQWKTTAWNASWLAADAVDNVMPDEVRIV